MTVWLTVQCDNCGKRAELPGREIGHLFDESGDRLGVRVRTRADCVGYRYDGERLICNVCAENEDNEQ